MPAQERLLASRVLLAADRPDFEWPSPTSSARCGTDRLYAGAQDTALDSIVARMRDLNSDSIVALGADLAGRRRDAGEGHSHRQPGEVADSRALGGVGPHFDLALVIVGEAPRSSGSGRSSTGRMKSRDIPQWSSHASTCPQESPCSLDIRRVRDVRVSANSSLR